MLKREELLKTAKPILFNTEMVRAILEGRKTVTRRVVKTRGNNPLQIGVHLRKGDILYVRETWSKDENGEYVYRTNYSTTEDDSFPPSMFKWKPSIHMPKTAARIFLKVTDVKVERLQDITEEQATAEGAKARGNGNCSGTSARIAFAEIWDKTVTEKQYEWSSSPWVWVYEFEVLQVD